MGVPVTIAVVSWNTRDLLRRALESMAADAERGIARVCVVDNASTDGSAELVRERFEWAELIEPGENLGFGSAVHRVARSSSSEWIATANADVALRPGALEELLAVGRAHPRAGAIAPRLVLPDGTTQHSVFAFPTVSFTLIHALGADRLSDSLADRFVLPGFWNGERAREVPWAVAAFLLVRRSAWDEVGGFDESQFMYAEDVDLGWRLRERGWATRYEPAAVVDHEHGAATGQLFGPRVEPQWLRSTYGLLARRRGLAYAWTVALINAAGAAVRGQGRWARLHLSALRGRRALESWR